MFDCSTFEAMTEARLAAGLGGRWYGVFPATVTDIKDPDGIGRVKVTLPWSSDTGSDRYEAWARVATLFAGNNRGSWFVPDVDDEVLVSFEGGDVRRPYVLGGLFNGRDAPPESMDSAGRNFKKIICSRNGVKVTLDDQDGQEKLILETPGGQEVTIKDGPGAITIADSNGNSMKLGTAGITITASAKVTLNASQVAVSAGMIKVDAGMCQFSGVLQCDVLISKSVISASYSPGAGNLL
jgi:uncharacterized protein involved in type VI secretion and phage assembly